VRPNTITILVLGVISLGTVHFLEKLAVGEGAPPAPFALGQTAVALAALIPVWLWKRTRTGLELWHSRRIGSLALIGVLASGVVVLLSIMALSHTSATHKGVIQAAYPMGTMVFAWLLLRERINLLGYVVATVIIAGLILMTSRGLNSTPNPGDWILIATIPLMGFTDAYSKKVLRDVPPVTVSLGRYLFGTLFLVGLLALVDLGSMRDLLPVWPQLLGAGLLSAQAMGFFYWAVKRIGPSLSAGFLASAPVVTVVLEWWWLDADFAVIQLLGVILVIGGAIVLARQHRVRAAEARG